MISCTSPWRRAYGWQRHGGMAPFILAEEKDLVLLPDELTYSDGAQVACGFGTVYEGLERVGVSGDDAVLVTGLGPVGLATAMLAKAMGASRLVGIDVLHERLELARSLSLFDDVLPAGPDNVAAVRSQTGGHGVERAFDCSAHAEARLTCIQATRKWGRVVFMGEGGTVGFRPSEDIIHDQKSVHGSWVTTIWRMEELVERLVRWNLHPETLITHRFPLERAAEAYALMASGALRKGGGGVRRGAAVSAPRPYPLAPDGVDPDLVPRRALASGATIPVVGLGTFGSDSVPGEAVAEAVVEAARVGYRHFDCASVYGNEHLIGPVAAGDPPLGHAARGPLDHLQALERQARRAGRRALLRADPARPPARLPRPLPRALAVPELPPARLRRHVAQRTRSRTSTRAT